MLKVLMVVFFVVSILGFVFAAEEWGDINVEDDVEIPEDVSAEDDSSEETSSSPEIAVPYSDTGEAGKKYTTNFYIALGVGTLVVLVIIYIIYLFIRGPNVKWKKSRPVKQ